MRKQLHENVARRVAPRARRLAAALVPALALTFAPAGASARQRTQAPAPQARRLTQGPRQPGAAQGRAQRGQARGVPADVLLRIVRAEDERRWDAAEFGAQLSSGSAAVRRRAALAAGRIGDEGAVAPLASLLRRERDETVRAMAAFALGEVESAAGADALLEALRLGRAPVLRARAVEALGKIAAALAEGQEERKKALGAAILSALEAEQRQRRPDPGVVREGLTAALRARPDGVGAVVALFLASPDARVRADAANVLARLRAKESPEKLRSLLDNDPDAVVRANAARALGAAEDRAALPALLGRAANDADLRVRVSAVRSLAALKDAGAAPPLLARAEQLFAAYKQAKTSPDARPAETNELLEVAAALGRVMQNTGDARAVGLLRQFRDAGLDAPEVETALARVAPALYVRDKPFEELAGRARGGARPAMTWQTVSALAQGLGEMASVTSAMGGNSFVGLQADAQIILRSLMDDPATPPLALPDLMRSLAAFKPNDLAAVMRAKLGVADVLARATAADILSELPPSAETTRALTEALPRALADGQNDAALSVLGALARQRSPAAVEAIRTALGVEDYLVRSRAAALLKEVGGAAAADGGTQTVATRNREADYARALSRVGKRVRATVVTDKGAFTIDLLPDDAPLTVDNFVELARRRFFDGLAFHRVVPNFVIQGGDPRGDGNGGPGHQIRCEINTVPYTRGAVGMALSGKDTGGSQWFVTHSPQPHLDGGYTVFGRVTEGMEVVDRITRGDRIRSVTVAEGRPANNAPRADRNR